jgi:hypothetical protein
MFTALAKANGITYQEAKIVFDFQGYYAAYMEQKDNPELVKRRRLANDIEKSGTNVFKPGCKTCGKKRK